MIVTTGLLIQADKNQVTVRSALNGFGSDPFTGNDNDGIQ
jgi:hypothetical protein